MTSEKENDDESIKDEQVRKDIQILSSRLYDLRERFMKVVQKINNDSAGFVDQLSEEDETTDDEMSVDEEDSDSTSSDDELTQKTKIRLKMQRLLIETILRRKSRHHEYLKHLNQYPKIMKYIINNNPNCINIPLRYLEPFIKNHVDKNPTGKIYDKITQQIQDIRRSYLKHQQ